MRLVTRTAILFAATLLFVGLGLSHLAPRISTATSTPPKSAPAGANIPARGHFLGGSTATATVWPTTAGRAPRRATSHTRWTYPTTRGSRSSTRRTRPTSVWRIGSTRPAPPPRRMGSTEKGRAQPRSSQRPAPNTAFTGARAPSSTVWGARRPACPRTRATRRLAHLARVNPRANVIC